MPEQYDNRGQVALWRSKSDNPKAPTAKGTVIAHRDIKEGETVDIALWRNDSGNERAPVMKGKIQDRQEGGQQSSQGVSQGPSQDFDDDIPF
jgi:hypothetical protein